IARGGAVLLRPGAGLPAGGRDRTHRGHRPRPLIGDLTSADTTLGDAGRMSSRPHIDTAQRRARIARRHALLPETRVRTLAEAAGAMTALHGTDNTSVYLQAQARLRESSITSIGCELYDEPTVLRMLAMRRTLFVVPLAEVAT